jgi:DNA-nicking Smr family endonuclease
MARRTGKQPTAADRAIWDQVRQTAKPLKSDHKTVTTNKVPPPLPPDPQSKQPLERLRPFRVGEAANSHGGKLPDKPHAPDAPRMDHATHRKTLRGKLQPEARIDLHGMTLAQAHPALIRFIRTAHDTDKRLVLVITGKGQDREVSDPIPIRRGVLRQQVPHWLHAPPIGPMILEVRPAHRRHGGGGAYYVYLRRRR